MHTNDTTTTDRPRPVLLVQFRANTAVAAHEAACFARVLERAAVPMETINLCAGDRLPPHDEIARRYGGFIAGGSPYSPLDDFPELPEAIAFTQKIAADGLPFLGVCFGFELLVHALGGTIVHDPARAEFGTNEIGLAPEGERDPVFAGLPRRFLVQHGHECLAAALPPSLVPLAKSAAAPYQAVRKSGANVYGVQFHPELSREDMRRRMDFYAGTELGETYFSPERYDRVRETPEAPRVLENFLRLCVG